MGELAESPRLFHDLYHVDTWCLKNWDYASLGVYFVTICTRSREFCFGEITNFKLCLSEIGEMASRYWSMIPEHFSFVTLDSFVVMPNHLHGIIIIKDREGNKPEKTGGITIKHNPRLNPFLLSKIIHWYKGRTAFEINIFRPDLEFVWQNRFYDRVIRDQQELERIRQYIVDNPIVWGLGKERNII